MPYCDVSSRVAKRNTALMVVSGLLLTSCVSAPLSREDRVGVDDGTDVCRTHVVALDSTGNFFAEDMLKGAIAGAGAGALTGGLAAALSGRSVLQGAVLGAAIGGVAGAVGGYFKSRMDQGRDQAIIAIGSDLNKEVNELEKADVAIRSLMACRMRQRDKIRSDFAAKRLSKDEAKNQWALLQQQVRKDNELIRMVSENIGKRSEEYKFATDQMVTEFDASKLSPEERQQATKRIASNNKRIDGEQQQEIAKIRREMSTRKKEKAMAAADLDREEKERIAQAKRAADAKKEVNVKTGGNEQVVAAASSFSASQAKKESIAANSASYAAKINTEDDSGFEKAAALRNFPMPDQIVINGGCPLPAPGQGVTISPTGWNDWLSSTLPKLDRLVTGLAA